MAAIHFRLVLMVVILFSWPTMGENASWDTVWSESGRLIRRLWSECVQRVAEIGKETALQTTFFPAITECLKQKSLLALDRALQSDVIPLYDGVDLVRYSTHGYNNSYDEKFRLNSTTQSIPVGEEKYVPESGDVYDEWRAQVIDRFAEVLSTHVLKIDLEPNPAHMRTEARRRRRHHMMPILMFGAIAMTMLVIPMGFKFLAVLGGKALLLAKMAILFTSIQGLKRVATSGLNYYPLPYPGWHDRHSRVENANNPYVYDNEATYPDHGHSQPDVQMAFG